MEMEGWGTGERQTNRLKDGQADRLGGEGQTEDRLPTMVHHEQQVPERKVPGFQRSNSRLMDISIKKHSIQKQLSIISEKSDRDFLLGEDESDPFDVDEIIRHLSSFSSDEQEIVTELNEVDGSKNTKESEGKEEEGTAAKKLIHRNSGEWRRISDTSGIR